MQDLIRTNFGADYLVYTPANITLANAKGDSILTGDTLIDVTITVK